MVVTRHRWPTRVWHWLNALTVFVMLMSGLMIFNAHPRLYWGRYGANFDHAWLQIGADSRGGFVNVEGLRVPTTGVLGQWHDRSGAVQTRAFPWWATIPSHYDLAGSRRWHLAFAWLLVVPGLLYWLWSFARGHFCRDLLPRAAELRPSHVWQDVKDHARLRFPTGAAALRYNILQKLSYFGVIFVALPLLVLTGLMMSPGMDAALPWLLALMGGRQSARSIHFVCAVAIAAFIAVHILMVLLAGPRNELRSIVTGRYRLPGRRA
ncbi:MAG: cytochrome b/b6 domain-containing protein [Sphingomonadaceae bacterium]|nr:cytochrome b/b6 domain-containing protein [Sphingomonadaceae bacterium]